MMIAPPLVLASQSPRRRRLLEQIDLPFRVHPSGIEEKTPDTYTPQEVVQDLALRKARAVAPLHPLAVTLGADTVVAFDNQILEKPADAQEAAAMLEQLSGRTHTVYTGLALVHANDSREVVTVEATDVTFGALDEQLISAYVASGSPMDKSGAYGIQDDLGALFVKRIEGDFYTVVGLPLHRLYQMLRRHFPNMVEV